MSTKKQSIRIGEGRPGPGRKKGIPNRLTADVKAMIEAALHDAGGRAYLARQAEENPAAFLALLGKIIPRQVAAEVRAEVARVPDLTPEQQRAVIEAVAPSVGLAVIPAERKATR